MGVDCSRPSRDYTELYLPADTFRLCNPRDRCWCDRGHHRDSRYYYVERCGDGRERFHDPLDYMDRFMMGGGWPMPWKDVRHWTANDYDRLGEILTEWNKRERGRQLGNMPGWTGMMPGVLPGMMPGMMMMGDDMGAGARSPMGFGRRGALSRHGGANMNGTLERILREHRRRLDEHDDLMFGSEREHREQDYMAQQSKNFMQFLQMLNGMNGMNNMGGQNPIFPGQGMGGMPQQYPGMGGMPMNGQMPPYGQYNPLNGMADPRLGGGLGGGLGRRSGLGRSRRRGLTNLDDLDDDDDLGDILRNRSRRRRGRRRWGEDDLDDELGLDGGSTSPRSPARPRPRGPNRPSGLGGGGGVAFDDDHVRPSRTIFRGTSPEIVPNPTTTAPGIGVANTPFGGTPVSSPPPGTTNLRPTAIPTAAERQRREMFFPPQGSMHPRTMGMGWAPGYPVADRMPTAFGASGQSSRRVSPRMGGAMPVPGGSGTRTPGPARNVSFMPGAGRTGLARSRSQEDNRGETEAGGTGNPRTDAEPT